MALIDNLVSYWKLDESSGNAADSKGSNTLANNGSMAYTAAKINNGAALTDSKFLSIADASQAGLDVTGDFSISFWFRSPSVNGKNPGVCGKWRASSGNRGYMVNLNGPDTSNINLAFRYSSDGINDVIRNLSGALAVNTTYHIVMAIDVSAGTCAVYVNGSLATTFTGLPSSVYDASSQPFEIGSNMGGAINYWNSGGWIDEFGFWARTLTGADVAALYNGGAGFAYPFTPPVVPPTVDTLAADEIEQTAAMLNGEITDEGGEDADQRGFVWGTTSQGAPGDVAPASAGYDDYDTVTGTFGVGVFDFGLTGLTAETTYYARAYAHNSEGYSYGDEISFATLAIPFAISGVVSLAGTPVEGAVVRCIRQSDDMAIAAQTTDVSGAYLFEDLDSAELYHLAVEYAAGAEKYNALSLWDVAPVEVI